jgi:hypothetical protein
MPVVSCSGGGEGRHSGVEVFNGRSIPGAKALWGQVVWANSRSSNAVQWEGWGGGARILLAGSASAIY